MQSSASPDAFRRSVPFTLPPVPEWPLGPQAWRRVVQELPRQQSLRGTITNCQYRPPKKIQGGRTRAAGSYPRWMRGAGARPSPVAAIPGPKGRARERVGHVSSGGFPIVPFPPPESPGSPSENQPGDAIPGRLLPPRPQLTRFEGDGEKLGGGEGRGDWSPSEGKKERTKIFPSFFCFVFGRGAHVPVPFEESSSIRAPVCRGTNRTFLCKRARIHLEFRYARSSDGGSVYRHSPFHRITDSDARDRSIGVGRWAGESNRAGWAG